MRQIIFFLPLLAGCSTLQESPPSSQAQFFQGLTALCGKSFAGKLVAGDESDSSFASAQLRAHVKECSANEVRIAFDVGEDRTRTWILSKTVEGMRLKHRHMLKDGTEDPVSQYGGDTINAGTVTRQEFPADDYSKTMFIREGRQVSTTNVWAFEIESERMLIYELARPGRLFRVSFDIAKPVTK